MSIVPPLAAELLQSLALLAVDTHLGHLHGRHIWSSEQRRRETLLGLEDVVVPPGRYEDGDAELHAPRSWCALALQLDAREVGEGGPDEDPQELKAVSEPGPLSGTTHLYSMTVLCPQIQQQGGIQVFSTGSGFFAEDGFSSGGGGFGG
eukprot:CAMPEP_0115180226 /NCGR_PEP_ID=MMETSP0270-20121206/6812_1 /TAXON_ID=71861 /ORGANISM="Scrippsiella trochoidea, Strain CCMP3099" /LENGTH=148 /DNA_ID=CAMNT_0002593223 /DNA_START=872 /DNA_END=1316 /DNA_ORIENTATION=+